MFSRNTAGRLAVTNMPFLEPVTYYGRTSGDQFSPTGVPRARHLEVSGDDWSVEDELLVVAELVWEISSLYLPSEPQNDDYLVDQTGAGWQVLSVKFVLNGSVFRLLCRKRT